MALWNQFGFIFCLRFTFFYFPISAHFFFGNVSGLSNYNELGAKQQDRPTIWFGFFLFSHCDRISISIASMQTPRRWESQTKRLWLFRNEMVSIDDCVMLWKDAHSMAHFIHMDSVDWCVCGFDKSNMCDICHWLLLLAFLLGGGTFIFRHWVVNDFCGNRCQKYGTSIQSMPTIWLFQSQLMCCQWYWMLHMTYMALWIKSYTIFPMNVSTVATWIDACNYKKHPEYIAAVQSYQPHTCTLHSHEEERPKYTGKKAAALIEAELEYHIAGRDAILLRIDFKVNQAINGNWVIFTKGHSIASKKNALFIENSISLPDYFISMRSFLLLLLPVSLNIEKLETLYDHFTNHLYRNRMENYTKTTSEPLRVLSILCFDLQENLILAAQCCII